MLRYFIAFLDYVRQQGIYIYRGDPAVVDFDEVDFTTDVAWHELNLSAIVPEHAKAVSVKLIISAVANRQFAHFRRAGQANNINVSSVITQVAGLEIHGDLTIPVDSDRKIEYMFANVAWIKIRFTVKGWWY